MLDSSAGIPKARLHPIWARSATRHTDTSCRKRSEGTIQTPAAANGSLTPAAAGSQCPSARRLNAAASTVPANRGTSLVQTENAQHQADQAHEDRATLQAADAFRRLIILRDHSFAPPASGVPDSFFSA